MKESVSLHSGNIPLPFIPHLKEGDFWQLTVNPLDERNIEADAFFPAIPDTFQKFDETEWIRDPNEKIAYRFEKYDNSIFKDITSIS